VTTPYFCIRKQANQAERERNAHLQGIHRCSIGNSPCNLLNLLCYAREKHFQLTLFL
jgi:hypothetical protein